MASSFKRYNKWLVYRKCTLIPEINSYSDVSNPSVIKVHWERKNEDSAAWVGVEPQISMTGVVIMTPAHWLHPGFFWDSTTWLTCIRAWTEMSRLWTRPAAGNGNRCMNNNGLFKIPIKDMQLFLLIYRNVWMSNQHLNCLPVLFRLSHFLLLLTLC